MNRRGVAILGMLIVIAFAAYVGMFVRAVIVHQPSPTVIEEVK
jgi:hypothetical protein